ncbi:MAG: hypothetical protein R3B41_00425 [Candidatus Doudnabacteria bacterium]
MEISQKTIDRLHKYFLKTYGVDMTEEETRESAESLIGAFSLLIEMDQKENQKQQMNSNQNNK